MREALAPHAKRRLIFTGVFVRFGKKTGWKGKQAQTVLLRDIKDEAGNVVADHMWFSLTVAFAELDLQPDDLVKFNARVTQYIKGYMGRREIYDKPPQMDYRLSRPTYVIKMTPDKEQLPLLEEGAEGERN